MVTMEDEQPPIDEVPFEEEIPLPEIANPKVCDQILGLAFASTACEGMGEEAERAKCRVDHIRPLEENIGKPGEKNAEDSLADLFVAYPGMSDMVINRFNSVVESAITKAQKIVDDKNADNA